MTTKKTHEKGKKAEKTETTKPAAIKAPAKANKDEDTTAASGACLIVGIGASAGGLEALQEFFDNMPASPGAAFVIVQHLSPDYKSFMDELLARHTTIPIEVVEDNTLIRRNHIYLIPPKMNMTIHNGTLHLKEIVGRALNLPIDIFFRSLAADQENNAIAIILSGTGSDGTLGIRAIKESGGMTMVQDDKSAKFDGMPRSSISTGMVDFILPPAQLAQELVTYIKHPFINKDSTIESQLLQNQSVFNKIIAILHDAKGIDFSNYKQNTIIRRLEKRISINRFTKVLDYVSYLEVTPKEVALLFNDLLIGVTRFFRDEKAFETFARVVVPTIFDQHPEKTEIRIWVPACSTGEEAYTIAILLKEYMTKNNIIKDVKIFATDIDEESLSFAGAGNYPSNISADVPPQYLTRYFIRRESGFQINDNIRRMIIFARHNIIDEPPFSKLDLVSCRNLLIYLNIDVQQKILSTFHVCLRKDGLLYLGSSETLGKIAEGFDVLDSKAKLYRKRNRYKVEYPIGIASSSPLHRTRMETHAPATTSSGKGRPLNSIFEELIHAYLPPSVVIDTQYNIIYTINDVSKFLHVPRGAASTSLLKMLPRETSVLVSSLIRRAEKKSDEITCCDVVVEDKSKPSLSLSCKRITGDLVDSDLPCYIVTFTEKENKPFPDVSAGQAGEVVVPVNISAQYQERIDELERELQHKNESLQATVEELETSNEELQSSNEELIASNEELQSTNEELQSVNEELYTVNAENIRKIEELTELNSDYDNLLLNTSIGTLYLDRNMVIRKVSDVASKITNVLPADVGRPIHHLSLASLYPHFLRDVDSVADTLAPIERAVPLGKRMYFMRIVPYRTKDNAVNGIIITFVEMSPQGVRTLAKPAPRGKSIKLAGGSKSNGNDAKKVTISAIPAAVPATKAAKAVKKAKGK